MMDDGRYDEDDDDDDEMDGPDLMTEMNLKSADPPHPLYAPGSHLPHSIFASLSEKILFWGGGYDRMR
jgi:hypothetical protein